MVKLLPSNSKGQLPLFSLKQSPIEIGLMQVCPKFVDDLVGVGAVEPDILRLEEKGQALIQVELHVDPHTLADEVVEVVRGLEVSVVAELRTPAQFNRGYNGRLLFLRCLFLFFFLLLFGSLLRRFSGGRWGLLTDNRNSEAYRE